MPPLLALLGLLWLAPLCAEDWTVLVYMAADNNLWQNAAQDVNDMESVALPANLDLIVQTDMPASSTYPGGLRRKIRSDASPLITSPLVADLGEIDSGAPQNLKAFINWGFERYPSQRRMLVIWGHGDNWFKQDDGKWICPDSGSNSLISVAAGELKQALTGIPHLDILLFDACSMQSLEVLAEVMHAADFVVGSEELVPATGFPYQTMIPLFASGSPEQIAGQITQQYLESYESGGIQNPDGFTNPITCSAIRTNALDTFYTGFRDYYLSREVHWPQGMLPIREQCWEMNTGYNDIDIGELLGRMNDAWQQWEPQLQPLIDKWGACVVASGSLNILHQVGSAALWFPYYQQYFDTWWTRYTELDFAQYRWPQILHRVYGPHGKPPGPIIEAQNIVLGNVIVQLRQPAYPDSLWYIVKTRPYVEGSSAILARPPFWQETFSVSVPVTGPGWLEIQSVNPWSAISDSVYVAYDYCVPDQVELLVTPNPISDRSLAAARWYLPQGLEGKVDLTLYNVRGQVVLSKSFDQPESGAGMWLLSAEPKFSKLGRGVYILSLKAGSQRRQSKLTIL